MGALKLLQIVANLLPLILATIKEIHPLIVRHPATRSAVFHMLLDNVKQHLFIPLSLVSNRCIEIL